MKSSPLIFLGAGASAPFDVPTMKDMVVLFEKELAVNGLDEQNDLWKDVKSKLEKVYGVGNVDIEHMLTFFSSPYINPTTLSPNVIYHYGIVGKDLIEVADPNTAKSLVEFLKTFVYESCDIKRHNDIFPFYSKLWATIASTSVRLPHLANSREFYSRPDLKVFTTNYDWCFEIFYNIARNRFRSHPEIILERGVRERYYSLGYYEGAPKLYKLHGSIRRYITKTGRVREYDGLRKEGEPVDGDEVVKEWMIWPLTGKYIYQYPYSELMYRFQKTLHQKNTWVFVGFSFRDEGINLILKNVNDRLEDQERKGPALATKPKNLILIDRSADKKKDLFKRYNMIHFWPITGEFGKDETFNRFREVARTEALFK